MADKLVTMAAVAAAQTAGGSDRARGVEDGGATGVGEAQDAFLKMLEDTPHHVYFLLATTNPHKLLNTIRTRSTELAVKAMKPDVLKAVLQA